MREWQTELLLLPDGRVLIHNLTPAMADLLTHIAPTDLAMHQRAANSRKYLKMPIPHPEMQAGSSTENTNS